MAELHIQRKKNVWAWVIALIVVLLLIGAVLMWMDGSRASTSVLPAANPTVDASVTAKGLPAAAGGDAVETPALS